MGVSARPENMVAGGGLFEEGPAIIRNPRFKKQLYQDKSGKSTVTGPPPTAFVYDLEFCGVNESTGTPEIKTEECSYSVGTGMEPSIDGDTPSAEGTKLCSPLKKSLVESTNYALFAKELFNVAPELMDQIGYDDDVSVLDGLMFDMKRKPQPVRDGLPARANNPLLGGSGAKARPKTFIMPVAPRENVPWLDGSMGEVPHAAKKVAGVAGVTPQVAQVAAKAAHAGAPKAAAKAPTAPPKAAPKAGAPAAKAAPAASNGGGDALTTTTADILMAAVLAAGGSMPVANVPKAVFDEIQQNRKDLIPQRAEILKLARSDGFAASNGMQVAEGLISLG